MVEQKIKVGDWVEELGGIYSGEVVSVNKFASNYITVKAEGELIDRIYKEEYLRLVPNYIHDWLKK